ncbi:hypothetical protein G6F31_018384 [Rhizopus arrhizus]|nr:hypothetical protein G6F31_018384 [Rhizopus arrhizus]
MATQVGRDVGLVFPQAVLDEQVFFRHTHGGHRHRGRASEQDREVVQRQRKFAQHQRNGVVAGGEFELARQDAQIGVHIGLQRHRTGVEQGGAARRRFGGGVAGGGHLGNRSIMRACHPGRASGNNLNPALSTSSMTRATPARAYFSCRGYRCHSAWTRKPASAVSRALTAARSLSSSTMSEHERTSA